MPADPMIAFARAEEYTVFIELRSGEVRVASTTGESVKDVQDRFQDLLKMLEVTHVNRFTVYLTEDLLHPPLGFGEVVTEEELQS